MKPIFALLLLLIAAGSCMSPPVRPADWELVWSDEFDVDGVPNPSKWIPIDQGAGWVNNEAQAYARGRGNYWVEDGYLILEARKEKYRNAKYTSARLMTQNLGDWKYCRMEVKAKLPAGKGVWPAIWMLPTNARSYGYGWPESGEIDIMENVGHEPNIIHASVHTKMYNWMRGNQRMGYTKVPHLSEEDHIFFMEWYPDRIDIGVDDRIYFTHVNLNTGWEAWPFDKTFYLILNIAIGGNWGGQAGIDDSIFPQRMEVDYVRVYRNKRL